MYGELFKKYCAERRTFFQAERKKEKYLWAGVLTQFTIVIIGMFTLPLSFHMAWAVTGLISNILVCWGLLTIWKTQRRYSSFDNWLKYHKKDE